MGWQVIVKKDTVQFALGSSDGWQGSGHTLEHDRATRDHLLKEQGRNLKHWRQWIDRLLRY